MTSAYYIDAMDMFRRHFGKKKKKNSDNVVFVFVSDDMHWGRRKLEKKVLLVVGGCTSDL